ncbi:MAG: exodeoxyribonuclease VII small subunit [Candidatus Anaerobiospirillum pullicola]|uniref:Exodeoxyribonuclease 7 small subunit n=1 Tax=Candidatus Anaerobiospirillum pullicola TaxID=2838451 RepID=A0A948WZR4_9GAMM|nr:exodeoxyribonuclease VII small subunit [Candidatus Anaerobiospirillum pullicola]
MDFKNLDEGLTLLEATVKELEDNSLSLDDAIDKYERGMKLAVQCRSCLQDMTRRVSEVRQASMQELQRLEAGEQNFNAAPQDNQQPQQHMGQTQSQPQPQPMQQPPMQPEQPQGYDPADDDIAF